MTRDVESIIDIVSRAQRPRNLTRSAYTVPRDRANARTERLTWSDVDRRSRAMAMRRSRGESRPGGARCCCCSRQPSISSRRSSGAFAPARSRCRPTAIGPSPTRGSIEDRTVARLRGMIPDAGVSLVLTVARSMARRSALEGLIPELRGPRWLTIEDAERSSSCHPVLPRVERRDVALLQYTSGSTSTPRGVDGHPRQPASQPRRRRAAGRSAIATASASRGCRSIHDMGLIDGVLQPAFSGFPLWLMAPAAFLAAAGAVATGDLAAARDA